MEKKYWIINYSKMFGVILLGVGMGTETRYLIGLGAKL